MRRDDLQPFDIEADEAADITQQFWGSAPGWGGRIGGEQSGDEWGDRTPRSIQALKSGLTGMRPRRTQKPARRSDATGQIGRTRAHGIPRPESADALELERREATLGELAAGWIDEDWPEIDDYPAQAHTERHARVHVEQSRPEEFRDFDEVDDDDLLPLSPTASLSSKLGIGAVDPLLARIGAIIVVGVMLVPLALSARGGGSDPLAAGDLVPPAVVQPASAATVTAGQGSAPNTDAGSPSPVASESAAQGVSFVASESATATEATAAAAATATVSPTPQVSQDSTAAPVSEAVGDVAESVKVAVTDPIDVATVTAQPERVEPDCSLNYEAGAGDSWFRIAGAAGVSPRALMDQNLAGTDTPIFPGDEICLPEGATVPDRPTTTAAPETTTAPPTSSTTLPPTTTSPPPAPVSAATVQEIIREVWPDELEEKALEIARRESSFKANAYNGSCCYGVFQLHWSSHKGWLDDYGITSINDLLDARKNVTAAYALYQRSGGFGPWGG